MVGKSGHHSDTETQRKEAAGRAAEAIKPRRRESTPAQKKGKGNKSQAQKANNRKRRGKQKKRKPAFHETIYLSRMKVSPTKAQCRQKKRNRGMKKRVRGRWEQGRDKRETNRTEQKVLQETQSGNGEGEEGVQQGLETQALHGYTHRERE